MNADMTDSGTGATGSTAVSPTLPFDNSVFDAVDAVGVATKEFSVATLKMI